MYLDNIELIQFRILSHMNEISKDAHYNILFIKDGHYIIRVILQVGK